MYDLIQNLFIYLVQTRPSENSNLTKTWPEDFVVYKQGSAFKYMGNSHSLTPLQWKCKLLALHVLPCCCVLKTSPYCHVPAVAAVSMKGSASVIQQKHA